MHGSDRVGILAPPAGAGGALLGRPQVPGVLYWDAREPLAGAGGAVRADGARHNGLYYYRTYYYRSQVLGVLCVPTEHVIYTFALALRSIRWELHKVHASRPPGGRHRKPTEKAS